MAESTVIDVILNLKDEMTAKLSGIGLSVGGVATNLSKFGGIVAGAMTAATAGTAAFGVSAIKAFGDAQASQARFEQSMKQVAKASDEQIASLRDQQNALMQITRFDDDAIASGQGFLATFQLSSKQVQDLTPRLLDMAEGLRDSTGATIGLEGASNMLGKAIQLGTVGMLQKAGVTIPGTTKAMQDLFKKNFELANVQERVAMIGELVDGNFKGQAESAGKTLAGSLDILKNNYGNLQEAVGQTLIEGLKVNEWLPGLTQKIIALIPTIEGIVKALFDWGTTAWNSLAPVRDVFSQVWATVSGFFDDMENRKAAVVATLTVLTLAFGLWAASVLLAMAPIILTIGAIGTAVFFLYKAWDTNWGGIQEKTQIVLQALTTAWNEYAMPLFKEIGKRVGELVEWWKQNWDTIKLIFDGAWKIMKGLFEIGWALISGTIKVAIDLFTGNWKKAWEDVKSAFAGVWNGIKDIFSGIWEGIKGVFLSGMNWVIDKINGFIDKANSVSIPGTDIHIKKIPRLATGTNFVPQDMLAVIHRGEAVVPRQYNPAAGGRATGGNITIQITGDNHFSTEADQEALIEKIKSALSREQERATWGIA